MNNDPVVIKKRRSIVKSACTRIRSYVDGISSITLATRSQLEEHKLKLDQHWADYNNYQTQLELLDESEANDRVAFEEALFCLTARIRDLLQGPSILRVAVTASPAPSNASNARE